MRRIIEEVPDIEEVIAGHALTGIVLQVYDSRDFGAKLNGWAPRNLGGHVFETVGPLVENAAHVRPEGVKRNAAGQINSICRKPHRGLRVGSDLVPAPARGI